MYLVPPQGFEVPSGYVCQLKIALYRLKRAPCQWYKEFSDKIQRFGFIQSSFDHYLFTLSKGGFFLVLIVYVDDILLTSNNYDVIADVKHFLHKEFTIKDLGEADYFLGIQIQPTPQGVAICQQKFFQDIL